MKYARVSLAREIDDTAKRLVLDLEVRGDNDVIHVEVHRISITNGVCETLVVNPTPTSLQDIVLPGRITSEDNPAVAAAFDAVMYSYMTGGLTAVLNTLQSLGIVPAGTAS